MAAATEPVAREAIVTLNAEALESTYDLFLSLSYHGGQAAGLVGQREDLRQCIGVFLLCHEVQYRPGVSSSLADVVAYALQKNLPVRIAAHECTIEFNGVSVPPDSTLRISAPRGSKVKLRSRCSTSTFKLEAGAALHLTDIQVDIEEPSTGAAAAPVRLNAGASVKATRCVFKTGSRNKKSMEPASRVTNGGVHSFDVSANGEPPSQSRTTLVDCSLIGLGCGGCSDFLQVRRCRIMNAVTGIRNGGTSTVIQECDISKCYNGLGLRSGQVKVARTKIHHNDIGVFGWKQFQAPDLVSWMANTCFANALDFGRGLQDILEAKKPGKKQSLADGTQHSSRGAAMKENRSQRVGSRASSVAAKSQEALSAAPRHGALKEIQAPMSARWH